MKGKKNVKAMTPQPMMPLHKTYVSPNLPLHLKYNTELQPSPLPRRRMGSSWFSMLIYWLVIIIVIGVIVYALLMIFKKKYHGNKAPMSKAPMSKGKGGGVLSNAFSMPFVNPWSNNTLDKNGIMDSDTAPYSDTDKVPLTRNTSINAPYMPLMSSSKAIKIDAMKSGGQVIQPWETPYSNFVGCGSGDFGTDKLLPKT